MPSPLRAGAARVTITPPVGILMAGYAGRTHGAVEVHDPLCARALYLTDGERQAVVIAVDICMWRAEAQGRARARIAAELGIPLSAQFLNDSHTHAGPLSYGGPAEDHFVESLIDQVVGLVRWAKDSARPARLSVGRAPVQIGVNRRERTADGRIILGVHPDGHVLPFVDVARFDDESGRPIACWYSHACHPTTLGPSHYMLSADFPGIASGLIETGLGAPALFLQGCCGDINSHPRDGLEHVAAHGRTLAEAVLPELERFEPVEVERVEARDRSFEVPLEPPPSLAEARRILAEREAAAEVAQGANAKFWAGRRADQTRALIRRIQTRDVPTGYPLTIGLLRLGGLALVALPTEIFSTLAAGILARSPDRHTTVLGYTNGWFGYFPDAPAWDEGGYEYDVRIALDGLMLAREAGEVMVGEATGMLAHDPPRGR